MKTFKPMLAHTVDGNTKISFPVSVSPKLDGIRAVVIDGVVYSRTLKPIRSKAVQRLFGKKEYNFLDGELIYGSVTDQDVFNKSTSFCMSEKIPEGMNDSEIYFYAFDKFEHKELPYIKRWMDISTSVANSTPDNVRVLSGLIINSQEELNNYEQSAIDIGYEGVMIRSLSGEYKCGRSTAKQGILGKVKRFSDFEAVVLGFEEKMHNTNEAKTNELGRTERSTAKEGLVGADTLGSLTVQKDDVIFNIGSGFNDEQRKEIWENKDKYLGKLVKYKCFDVQSGYDAPRFPIFLGWRDKDDI